MPHQVDVMLASIPGIMQAFSWNDNLCGKQESSYDPKRQRRERWITALLLIFLSFFPFSAHIWWCDLLHRRFPRKLASVVTCSPLACSGEQSTQSITDHVPSQICIMREDTHVNPIRLHVQSLWMKINNVLGRQRRVMGDWTAPDRKRAVQAAGFACRRGASRERKSDVAPGAMELELELGIIVDRSELGDAYCSWRWKD